MRPAVNGWVGELVPMIAAGRAGIKVKNSPNKAAKTRHRRGQFKKLGEQFMFFNCADCLETAPTKIAHTEVSRTQPWAPAPNWRLEAAITGTLGSVRYTWRQASMR